MGGQGDLPIQQGWMPELKYCTNNSASVLSDPQISALYMGLLCWTLLHCALLEVCHCASVAVNFMSLSKASEVKPGLSFLLLTFCDEREKVISKIFPCIVHLS